MNDYIKDLIEKLEKERSLTLSEYEELILAQADDTAELLSQKAVKIRQKIYGNSVYVRGLIEISNICKNDCLYCGIRRPDKKCERDRLRFEDIMSCCEQGYSLGFRTFVLQGGEDGYFTDEVACNIVGSIRE